MNWGAGQEKEAGRTARQAPRKREWGPELVVTVGWWEHEWCSEVRTEGTACENRRCEDSNYSFRCPSVLEGSDPFGLYSSFHHSGVRARTGPYYYLPFLQGSALLWNQKWTCFHLPSASGALGHQVWHWRSAENSAVLMCVTRRCEKAFCVHYSSQEKQTSIVTFWRQCLFCFQMEKKWQNSGYLNRSERRSESPQDLFWPGGSLDS